MDEISEIEYAWAAGLFEGEGSIYKKGNSSVLCIQMTDLEPLERFAKVIGTTVRKNPYYPKSKNGKKYKPIWSVSVVSRIKISRLFSHFEDYLSPRRINQWKSAVDGIILYKVRQGESWTNGEGCPYCKPLSQAGYKRHKSLGEQPCNDCLKSYAEYTRELYRKGVGKGRKRKK